MEIIDVLSYIGVVIALVAVTLSSNKNANLYRVFWLYFCSNFLSITYFLITRQYQYLFQNIVYFVIAIRGIINNRRKK